MPGQIEGDERATRVGSIRSHLDPSDPNRGDARGGEGRRPSGYALCSRARARAFSVRQEARIGLCVNPISRLAVGNAKNRVASVEGITEYRLDNGLKVLLFPDSSQPTVAVNVTDCPTSPGLTEETKVVVVTAFVPTA